MATIDVQGIVALKDGLPYIQFRTLDENGEPQVGWQLTPGEAREFAQNVLEASTNAVYDAALIAWAKEVDPENEDMGPNLVGLIRKYRADKWGLPDNPDDWRGDE